MPSRSHLHKEIEDIKSRLLQIGTMVEGSLLHATEAVKKKSAEEVNFVRKNDDLIDQMEVELEEDVLKILALYQPIDQDLRFLVAALKINNDLERIGDLSLNISEASSYLAKEVPVDSPFDVVDLSTKVRLILKKSLDSLVHLDHKLAYEVVKEDKEIDSIHVKTYDVVFLEIENNPTHARALIRYLAISKQLERIADYATSIAEDVIYMNEGKIIRHNRV